MRQGGTAMGRRSRGSVQDRENLAAEPAEERTARQAMRDLLVHQRALLPPFLLLLVGERPGHGYDLAERLKCSGFDRTALGTVYGKLRQLENAQLVRSAWSPVSTGPVPRVYELTATGRSALDNVREELDAMELAVQDFRRRHRALTRPGPEGS
jgi:DNA-binding PadR family transcriptional regulator